MKTAAFLLALASGTAFAAPFTAGNLLVYRVGANNGTETISSAGTAVFIDEWTASGSYVQSINTGVFAAGNSTSEGQLSRSANGQYVTFAGYASAAVTIAGTAGTTINRTVSVLTSSGTVTTTNFTDFASGGNPRAATTTNGTDFWMVGGQGGVRYGTSAGGTSIQLSTTITNIRSVEIANDQLYVSALTGAFRLATVGTGVPTTSGNTITNLPGYTTGGGSPYDFAFADLSPSVAGVDTVYVADDGAGQIQKYSLVGGNWTASGSVTGATGVRGLTVSVNGDDVRVFGSAGGASTGSVYSFIDATGYNSAISGSATLLFSNTTLKDALGSAGTNFIFRGISFAPVSAIPEPSSLATLTGLGALVLTVSRRRRA